MAHGTFTVDKENLEVRMEYSFKATPERLFKAFSTPEEVEKWWGPKNSVIKVETMDFRVGGKWRIIHIEKDGSEYPFSGEYLSIDEPQSYSYTFTYEPWPDTSITETITLTALVDGFTQVRTASHYKSLEDLERMVQSGMEKGATESMDRLEQLVSVV